MEEGDVMKILSGEGGPLKPLLSVGLLSESLS